ncbi:MAG: biopolymer transporter ExbD, partial [bacterium]
MSFPVSKVFQVKPRKSQISGQPEVPKLQLTSLIDVMTILLVFLLKSFSSEGEIVTVSEGLLLPESSAKQKPRLALVIAISRNELIVEDKQICTLVEIEKQTEMIIPGLEDYLVRRKSLTEAIAEYSSSTEFKGDVVIQADR